ncbi:hypothetical protein PHMEG_00035759 [Phytophthora megakarya]|uniref:Auto-transporter adhesin head GIN domain-containing protein n=1 Tax=Phytophthora megakarya TaxID=4795 RepID=A0A225UNE9_9STRA|nr:hypothetical protein PHMEG_00035759 [Phytophthora megakarya]
MKVSSFHALLVAAASLLAHATADFKVSPGEVTKIATSKHVNYVKQWTLNASGKPDSVNSIDLSLAGNAYVSYVKGLPAGVIGYVNVSSDSRGVANAVTVSKDVDNELDDDADDMFDSDNNGGELKVWFGNKADSGYMLTEIFLASPRAVHEVKSQGSVSVVIEKDVFVSNNERAELKIEAIGSSAVYVSAPAAAVSVMELSLDAKGSAIIEYNVESLSTSELSMEAQGTSSIAVLASTVVTSQLDLEVGLKSSGCFSAENMKATQRKIKGKVSMPNSSKKFGTTGTATCAASKLPPRKAARITDTTSTGTNRFFDDDDNDDNDLDDMFDNDRDDEDDFDSDINDDIDNSLD